MIIQENQAAAPSGVSFMIDEARPENVVVPEDFSDEHRMIAEMTEKFVQQEVVPVSDRIEEKDLGLTTDLLRKAGALGLLSIEVPEIYGGLGLDPISALIVCEQVGQQASFGTSYGGHSGIGTLPIVYFGTTEQKERYLPRIASGEMLSAFALTEAASGSDALAARTRAVLSDDGKHYILNGQKMWITNAGFADVFVIFAKVDGAKFTAFIVERTYPGFSVGTEEKKMGLLGSSTCLLNLDDVHVPVENVLGGVGRGARVALDVLNIGRLKLGASCVGAMRVCLNEAIRHAAGRKLFGKSLADFGAIKHKLAEMAIQAWVAQGAAHRAAGMLTHALHAAAPGEDMAVVRALEEFVAECALVKIWCSEALDYVVDEAVQVFGGYGYSREYVVERQYRDSRINRIFEGTNEINRLVVSGALLKKALRGRSTPLLEAAARVKAAMEAADAGATTEYPAAVSAGPLAHERELVSRTRNLLLYVTDLTLDHYKKEITEQEEIQFDLADTMAELFCMETAVVRTLKMGEARPMVVDITRTFCNDAFERVVARARRVAAATVEGEALQRALRHVARLGTAVPIDTVAARRRIAEGLLEAGQYPL